ncbi:MAG TPA: hypothetical protein VFW87_11890 [Pirellulales bacterium]|nr:hypothetical protein [Pirellulales bacterium]
MQINARLSGRDVVFGRVETAAKAAEMIGFAAGLTIGGGMVINAAKTGGKWGVVKLVAIAAGAAAAEQGIETGLRAARADETVIRGFRLAVAVVSYIVYRRRLGAAPPEPPPPGAPKLAPPANTPTSPPPARPSSPKGGLWADPDHAARVPQTANLVTRSATEPNVYINTRYVIDMTGAPEKSRTNAAGFARNAGWYWRQMLRKWPELFSDANKTSIRRGRAPVIDDTWLEHNPMHQPFKGDKLIHHHIDQGKMASALPEPYHQDAHTDLHPKKGTLE